MFKPSIFDAARAIEPSWRDELEITDAIQTLVDRGLRVEPHIVRGWWKDMGQLDDLLEANRLILEDLRAAQRRRGDRLARRGQGRDRGRARASSARPCAGPTIIGAGSRIVDSYVGPYSRDRRERRRSSAPRSSTRSSSSGAHISDLSYRMEASLIGRNVKLTRSNSLPKAYRFMVGDNSEIQLH